MSGQRQKNRPEQEVLAFPAESRSEAPKAVEKGSETPLAKRPSESLAGTERLIEEVCEWENQQALQRVKASKGSPGVDGMTVDQLPDYLKQHGLEIGVPLCWIALSSKLVPEGVALRTNRCAAHWVHQG